MTEEEIEKQIRNDKRIKGIKIKVVTYNNMYYTYACLNEETIMRNELNKNLDKASLISNGVYSALDELYNTMRKEKFILSRFENKIINVQEIKETALSFQF